MVRPRLALGFVLALVLTACAVHSPGPTPPRPLGLGERWLPVANWEVNGVPLLCAGGGFIGDFRLHGSPTDPHLVWLVQPDGKRRELGWPLGYSARFAPSLEVIDEVGHVIAREGSLATGGCPTADPDVLSVEF